MTFACHQDREPAREVVREALFEVDEAGRLAAAEDAERRGERSHVP